MQTMGDAVAVLGSRLGLAWEPGQRRAYLVRFGEHPGIPIALEAGITVEGRTRVLPLAPEGDVFSFLDQGMTPTAMTLGGIDPETGLHVKLTVRIPFRPRDADFSTTPALFLCLSVERLQNGFRWERRREGRIAGRAFLRVHGETFSVEPAGEDRTLAYPAPRAGGGEPLPCRDRLVRLCGDWEGDALAAHFDLPPGGRMAPLSLAWCAHDAPVLDVLGDACPFRYTDRFPDIASVAAWARAHAQEVEENGRRVDALLRGTGLGASVEHLLAQTLHSWLLNTWWVLRPNGQEWFTVWEGSCYFHSTVDVEYTQGPFYLTVWPELLEMELDEWPLFAKDGQALLGGRGRNTSFLSHDMGERTTCAGQSYPHEMEVEESANYLLMAYAHWRRTGRDDILMRQAAFIRKLAAFLVACDTTGNGIPDAGCANTIDDGSPAIQYGAEQVYLGVKAMAACRVAAGMLEHAGEGGSDTFCGFAERARATIEERGWLGDHYAVTLTRTLDGTTDPWTGKPQSGPLLGWDACHIYTANGLALLDMVGHPSGLSDERLAQDIRTATPRTLGKYGCRHTDHVSEIPAGEAIEGLAGVAPTVGWVSMNMLRDIAAAYRGEDLLSLAGAYWDYQATTNSREVRAFFETFYGNNLCFYPRGVAVFGYLDAAVGFRYDAVTLRTSFAPVRASLRVPLLLFADWEAGTAPMVSTRLEEGCLSATLEGRIPSA